MSGIFAHETDDDKLIIEMIPSCKILSAHCWITRPRYDL